MSDSESSPASLGGYQFTIIKKAVLGVALCLTVVGGILHATGDKGADVDGSSSLASSSSGGAPGPGNSLVGSDGSSLPLPLPDDPRGSEPSGGQDSEIDAESADGWSPAMLRGGFGMAAGFCIGLAMRVFLRLAAIFVGFNLLVMGFFSYIGWVEVRWDAMQSQMDPILHDLGREFASFRVFLQGIFPSAGLFGVGLFTGLRKK